MTDFNFKEDTLQKNNTNIDEVEARIETVKKQQKIKEKNENIIDEIKQVMGDDEKYQLRLKEKIEKRRKFTSQSYSTILSSLKPYLDNRFEYHFFNDSPGRILKMQNKGWDLVYNEEIAKMTGQNDLKSPIKIPTQMETVPFAYLMRIEKELYEEDKKEKEKIIKEKLDLINGENNKDLEVGEIKIER